MSAPVSELTENKAHKGAMRYPLTLVTAIVLALHSCSWQEAQGRDHQDYETHDADRARQALEKGEVLPLDDVLARLRAAMPGEISGVELEKEGGVWVYEFKVISPAGRMVEVRIDAKTGQPIGKSGESCGSC